MQVLCKKCRGEGEIICSECHGEGIIKHVDKEKINDRFGNKTENDYDSSNRRKCSGCGGKGKIKCPLCSGNGIIDMPTMA